MANYQSIYTGQYIDNIIGNALLQSTAANIYLSKVDAAALYPTKTGGDASGTWAISITGRSKYTGALEENQHNKVDINTWIDTSSNIHTTGGQGEMQVRRFFSQDEAGSAYNLPCVDTHNLIFSIDNGTSWNRILTFDIRTNDIYTKSKVNNSWNSWNKIVLQKRIYSRVRYNGSGDVQFSGWIPFNTIESNVGGGSWSNGYYIVPEAGVYIANFTCYSNQSTEGRVSVAHLNSSNTSLEMNMNNGNYSASVTGIYQCNANDRLVAGAYSSSFPIRIYAASGHNEFTVCKIPGT